MALRVLNFLFLRQLAVNVKNKKSQDTAKEEVNTNPSDNSIIKVGAVKKKNKTQHDRAETRPISPRHLNHLRKLNANIQYTLKYKELPKNGRECTTMQP